MVLAASLGFLMEQRAYESCFRSNINQTCIVCFWLSYKLTLVTVLHTEVGWIEDLLGSILHDYQL